MRILYFLFAVLLLSACGAAESETTGRLPEDYDSLHQLYIQKQSDLKVLQDEIATIEDAMQQVKEGQNHVRKLVSSRHLDRRDFNRYIRVQGSVAPEDIASVSTEIGGRITRLTVDEGDPVRRGQHIATIDMESVEKQKAELETQLALARTIYERQSRLWEQNIGSEIQYLQAKNNVERLEKSIESLESQLSKSRLYAPITGVVDIVQLKAGEAAIPGMPIVTILSTSDLKVVADVPESLLGKIHRGDKVHVVFPSLGEEMDATVTKIGRKIDPANRTISVEIAVPSLNGMVKPNLLAEILVNDLTIQDTLVISQELIQQEVSGRNFIMVVDRETGSEPTAKKIYVQTGPSYGGDVVVTKGLNGEEEIITNGARGLSAGEALEISSTPETTLQHGQE